MIFVIFAVAFAPPSHLPLRYVIESMQRCLNNDFEQIPLELAKQSACRIECPKAATAIEFVQVNPTADPSAFKCILRCEEDFVENTALLSCLPDRLKAITKNAIAIQKKQPIRNAMRFFAFYVIYAVDRNIFNGLKHLILHLVSKKVTVLKPATKALRENFLVSSTYLNITNNPNLPFGDFLRQQATFTLFELHHKYLPKKVARGLTFYGKPRAFRFQFAIILLTILFRRRFRPRVEVRNWEKSVERRFGSRARKIFELVFTLDQIDSKK